MGGRRPPTTGQSVCSSRVHLLRCRNTGRENSSPHPGPQGGWDIQAQTAGLPEHGARAPLGESQGKQKRFLSRLLPLTPYNQHGPCKAKLDSPRKPGAPGWLQAELRPKLHSLVGWRASCSCRDSSCFPSPPARLRSLTAARPLD